MPVSTEDDWSDSDDEIGTGMETDVLLGVPDGRMETESDIKDAAVSVSAVFLRFCLHGNLHFRLPSARSARILWSSSCRCGVRSKTALWTVHCMSGAVLVPLVRDRLEAYEHGVV